MKYSHIICIGDSITNERDHYSKLGILDIFDQRGYDFKSYPEFLGDHYKCPVETFGKPGMTMPFTMMELLDKVDYILSLENPLIIYQFGIFFNATLKVDNASDILWKDLNNAHNNSGVVIDGSESFSDKMDIDEKMAIATWFSKYEEFRNYWYIEEFIAISEMINRMKPTNIFGMIYSKPKFKIPTDYHLLNMWDIGAGSDTDKLQNIDFLFPDIIDGHKTTEANQILANEIIRQINTKR